MSTILVLKPLVFDGFGGSPMTIWFIPQKTSVTSVTSAFLQDVDGPRHWWPSKSRRSPGPQSPWHLSGVASPPCCRNVHCGVAPIDQVLKKKMMEQIRGIHGGDMFQYVSFWGWSVSGSKNMIITVIYQGISTRKLLHHYIYRYVCMYVRTYVCM